MQVEVISVTTRKHFRDFLEVPFNLHKHDNNWVPPLRLEIKKHFDHRNPFLQNAAMQSWVAYKNSKPIGRITGILNHSHNQLFNENIAFWGFFESDESIATAEALFAEVEKWAKNLDVTAIRGPMNPSINSECGLQISAFDTKPYVMMTQNPAYYPKFVDKLGYSKVKDLHAWLIDSDKMSVKPEFVQKLKELQLAKAITIRHIDMKNFDKDIQILFQLSNDAWEKNWGFIPFTSAEFKVLAKDLREIIVPEMIYILEMGGKPVAFSVWIPDINQILIHNRNGKLFPFGLIKLLWHLKIKKSIKQGRLFVLGTSKEYQHLPLGAMLYVKYLQEAPKLGFKICECSWVLEDNVAVQSALHLISADHYKTYRVYEKSFQQNRLEQRITQKYKNMTEILDDVANHSADKIGFKFLTDDTSHQMTYLELQRKSKALAALLQQCPHPYEKERVVLLLPPGLDYIIAFFACLYAGMIPIPAYPPRRNHHNQRLQSIINNAQANFVLTHQQFVKDCPRVPHVITVDSLDESLINKYQPKEININDIAFLQYTSGSTNDPKGVMITHKNLLANFDILHTHIGRYTTSGCSWLPLYHDMGLIGGILYPILVQATMVLMSPAYFLQAPLRWLKIISEEKIATTMAPNFAFDLCIKKATPELIQELDLSHWRYALNGAEPIRHDTLQHFTDMFSQAGFSRDSVVPVYGMAEATLIVTAAEKRKWYDPIRISKSQLEHKKAVPVMHLTQEPTVSHVSCGQSQSEQIIRIVNPLTLECLHEGQIGEIWISGPCIAPGYWNNAELSNNVFNVKLPTEPEFSFLRTGDLGFLNENELCITGRYKDLIIIHGANHYPQDIEHTVVQSHPALLSHGTAAFSIEGEGHEELVVMQEIARTYLNKIDVSAVLQAIRQSVFATHGLMINSIVLLKPMTLPKTSSGKIQRWLCKRNDSLTMI